MTSPLKAPPAMTPMFGCLSPQPADALLGMIQLCRGDPRPTKIDLGVGVYRDDAGRTPIMRAVKQAEELLLSSQFTKSYLGPEGDVEFVERLATIVFGQTLAASPRMVGLQTPGGTGALRLGAELIARAKPEATVWLNKPTWPNHAPIFEEAGLKTANHRFFDTTTSSLQFDLMTRDLERAVAGDVVLLHGCCHNPTGAMLSDAQWQMVADLCNRRGLIPFIDLAYQGLGDGLEDDAVSTRILVEAIPEALIAYSCDKNFGLYRERVGGLWVSAASAAQASIVQANLFSLARSLWSMPPDHGAAIVRTILQSAMLTDDWLHELTQMRERINGLRQALGASHPALQPIARQRGMFAMLPLSREQAMGLRSNHGIYMTDNARINIAGLTYETMAPFLAAIASFLDDAGAGQ